MRNAGLTRDSSADRGPKGLLGLARIKVLSVGGGAMQWSAPAQPPVATNHSNGGLHSNGSLHQPQRARFFTSTYAWGTVTAAALVCSLATLWHITQGNALFDVRNFSHPVAASDLRRVGERAAAQFPGLKGMGLQLPHKRPYMPFNALEAVSSCEGSGQAHGAPPMTVLVTGAAGFIGYHAAIMLHLRGHGVLGIDNFNDYYPVALKRARQAAALSNDVYIVDGDLSDSALLGRIFDTCAFTHVLHLAAQAGVRYAAQNPYSYVHANVLGHVTLLEAIVAQTPMPALVYASSSSVYGLNTKQPFSEGDRVDNPASLYAATKRSDELICHTYHNIHGLSVTGLRFFTVYGPWGRPDMAAFKFAKNIMLGKPIKIFQGPNRSELSRDFTYVDDIVSGAASALAVVPPSGKGSAHYKIYNLGNTRPHTVTEMVSLLERHLGREAVKRYVPVPPTGDVLATSADISAAQADLRYMPETRLDEGIRLFCEWFRQYYNLAESNGPEAANHGKAIVALDWAYDPL